MRLMGQPDFGKKPSFAYMWEEF
uniref:Uncharacterized protein n=1 Tax=Anguilla anguilla TaxID=7936 RepID=A0A0E9RAQ0_ANGAN